MSDRSPEPQESLLVRELVSTLELGLDLEVIQGHRGMEKTICSPRIQKLGLTLAGFTGYIHPTRIQVFGGSEHNYLLTLDAASRKAAIARLEGCGISCVLVTKNLEIPEGLLEIAFNESIPLLRTSCSELGGHIEDNLPTWRHVWHQARPSTAFLSTCSV